MLVVSNHLWRGRGGPVRRLLILLGLLMRRSYSVGELALKTSVSPRTVRRDIVALGDAGVPLMNVPVPGLDGAGPDRKGWRVMSGWDVHKL